MKHLRTYGPPSAEVVFDEPVRKVGGRWLGGFSAAWLGIWIVSLTPSQFLIPAQLAGLLEGATWQETTRNLGFVLGAASAASAVTYPLVGAVSDRTTSRFGRRRPWIVAGVLVTSLALYLLSLQSTFGGVALWWSAASAGVCLMGCGLTSLIADQVPVHQRGLTSGFIAAPQAVGVIAGVLLVTTLLTGIQAGYLGLAALLLVLVAPFLLILRDPPLSLEARSAMHIRSIFEDFWVNPVQYPDFGWTLLSRALANLANAMCVGLLLYFLMFGLERPNPEDDLLLLTVVYAVTSVLGAVACGWLSDRMSRRRMFVVAAAGLQAAGCVPLIFLPSFTLVIVSSSFLGLSWGCYQAVDQALATQVLPDARSRGKDLGIMNLAAVVPTGAGPLLGALIVSATGSFRSLFVAAVVIGVASALAALPIRGVR